MKFAWKGIVVASFALFASPSFGDLWTKPEGEKVHEGRSFRWDSEKIAVSGEGYWLGAIIRNELQKAGGGELDCGETYLELGGDLTYALSESQTLGFSVRGILPDSALVDSTSNNRLRVQGYLDSPELWRLGGGWQGHFGNNVLSAFIGRDQFVYLPMERFSRYYGTRPLILGQTQIYDQGVRLGYSFHSEESGRSILDFSASGVQGDRDFGMSEIRDDTQHNSDPSWIFTGKFTPTALLESQARERFGDFSLHVAVEEGTSGSNPGSKEFRDFWLLSFVYGRDWLEVWYSFGNIKRGWTQEPLGAEETQGWAAGILFKQIFSSPLDLFLETSSAEKDSGPSVDLWRRGSDSQQMNSIGLRWNLVKEDHLQLNLKGSYTMVELENPRAWTVLQKDSQVFLFELEAFFR